MTVSRRVLVSDVATIRLDAHHASAMENRNRNGHRKAGTNGNWIRNHSLPFLCSLLKCCPRKRNGTSESNTAKSGLIAPHGPMPPLNSFHIAEIIPKGLEMDFSSCSSRTTYSSSTIIARTASG
ncbi:MAG: hypothetical protein CMA12_01530 [Euryarchaeota archaeon]|nr:hypothetical protein [Euryarchaeota archaeon]OUW22921.1 MAG: hypothetical protein CBD33_00105 [Euryarchaeota archaeon TMED173]